MTRTCEIAVVGSGAAAACAARLLHVLGHDVMLVSFEGARPFDPHVLLPESALASLRSLGLRDAVCRVGRPIGSHEIRWEKPDDEDVPGRDSALQISEGLLAETLSTTLAELGVPVIRDEVQAIEPRTPIVVVHLADGSAIEAPIVLCSVPALFPEALRAKPLALADSTVSFALPSGDAARFPAGHHLIEALPTGWAWAVRQDEGTLQVTAARDAAEGPWKLDELGAVSALLREGSLATTAASAPSPRSLPRQAAPSIPSWGWDPALVPIGRAAFAASPLSSLGTSHAIQSAYLAAALAHTRLGNRGIDSGALAQWYTRETMRRALHTHALTSLACRGPYTRFGTPYWATRSADAWAVEGPSDLVNAAKRSRAYVEHTQAGRIDEVLLQRSPSLLETTVLFQQGPSIHPQLAVMPPDGLPLDRHEWSRYARLAASFSRPNTLGRVVAQFCASPASEVERHECRKKIGQRVGRLVEAGVLEFVASVESTA